MVDAHIERLRLRLFKARDELNSALDELLQHKREELRYTLRKGKVIFDQGVRRIHRRTRVSSVRYVLAAPWGHILSAPVIYGMIVPLFALDLSITLYQHICFRIYRIPRVRRDDYIVIDRHRLPYLNTIQKLNCVYCGYGNGLMSYAREIIARTEQYWCPIKHARRARAEHERTVKFVDYGDAEAWRSELKVIRCDWEK